MVRLILAVAALLAPSPTPAQPFHFVAYGDTGYMLPRDQPRVERLIDRINREEPDFVIHVGDFKGYSSCSDAAYEAHRRTLARHRQPVILTPGDNDWTDCDAESAGGFDPIERLNALRRLFFGTPQTLGGATMAVTRQSTAFPENALWTHEGVVFATINVPGPHNDLVMDKARAIEAIERTTADTAWIARAFALARERRAHAVVLAFQIDVWISNAPAYEDGPVAWLRDAIGKEASTFEGQVLVVHGDSHRLIIDTPYRRPDIDAGTTRGLNVTRLQVPGWPDHRAVRIDVDPSRPDMFRFGVIMAAEEASGARP